MRNTSGLSRRSRLLAKVVASLVLVTAVPAGRTVAEEPNEKPRAARSGDRDELPAEARTDPNDIRGLTRAADLVADVVLAEGITHVPAPLRITVTDYRFTVKEVVKGKEAVREGHVTARNPGGELADGTGMVAHGSVKLSKGDRYLIFARKSGNEFRLLRIFQVRQDGSVVADEAGRYIVGLREGRALTQTAAKVKSLHYRPSVAPSGPGRQGPPDQGTHPLAAAARAADLNAASAIGLDALLPVLREAASDPKAPAEIAPKASGAGPEAAAVAGPSPLAITGGGYVSDAQNHYLYLPSDNNWNWYQNCAGDWNHLVADHATGPKWLFGYLLDANNNPIRNVLPVANDGKFNLGVLNDDQMKAGGYDTWENLGANGETYVWFATTNGRVKETDVLINPSAAADEAQYRKSLTHEMGHAQTLQHEDREVAIMRAGTYQQPPNYASWWYARLDDMFGVQGVLAWVNANVGANTWNIAQFTDMATYSQAHEHPGTSGNLVMTSLSVARARPGDQVTFNNVHIENRGNVAAQAVTFNFYLSTDPVITAGDFEMASYTWSQFNASVFWTGSLAASVPSSVPPGNYYVGWIVTTTTAETSTANNTTIMRDDLNSGFSLKTLSVVR